LTTGDDSPLFVEEPESHLHARAQRFLIERLYGKRRQVFLTTHSPVFINIPGRVSLQQVTMKAGRTAIARVKGLADLSGVLEDIGARNSDVLLSDAVVFVEGPADKRAFEFWSETIGKPLAESNITVLPMGGGEFAERGVRARAEILEGISQRAPVPC